ncbi:solute carrier family 22 member 3-like [Scyliorhinus canicula]|uniref:solute carrier family 22 member 3-like n=1 Tax=Scyliorhinus canicula TaxID=7830 RepID=UPI0018F49715|nr:solute carrier family 22 member 3-like [Scyliorhinus canicula]
MLTYDDVLKDIGDFGKYQRWIILLLSFSGVTFSFLITVSVFQGDIPNHWCRGPPGTVELREKCGWSLEQERNYTVPLEKPGSSSHSRCEHYNIDWNATFLSCDYPVPLVTNNSGDVLLAPCQNGWFFEGSRTTIISEYELVCEDAWKVDMSQACLEIGFFLGALITGYAADRFGRKLCLLACLAGTGISGIAVAVAPTYSAFVIFQILEGLFGRGICLINSVLATELVGPRYRRVVIFVTQVVFSLGLMLLPGFAYMIRSWKGIQMAITVPHFVLLLYCCLIPESPRWLLSRKRIKEALKIAQDVAEQNGKSLPSTYKEMIRGENSSEEIKNPSLMDLFRTPQMRKRTLILMYSWFTSNLVYLGLILRLGVQGGDTYIDLFVAGAVELPATLLGFLLVERVGRRSPFVVSHIVAGTFCLLAACISKDMHWFKTAVASLGRCGITMSISILFLVTNELQPTSIRNFGVSICSSLSAIGGIAAPFVLFKLATVWSELPLVIFGVLCLVAGGLVHLLPETRGTRLPETVDDVENIIRLYEYDQDECKEMIDLHIST